MLRILVVFLVLLVVAAVALHFVLQSAWLAEFVLARASAASGLDVRAGSFSTTWGGTTTLRQVTIQMPLSEETILQADRITIEHQAVPWLLLGRPLRVEAVEVDGPAVNVRQDESGRWNVQEVWTRVRASFVSPERLVRKVRLPEILVRDATLQITEPNETVQTVGPADFEGRWQGRMLWVFALQAPPLAKVQGRLAPGEDWAHEVDFAIEGIGPLVRDLWRRDLSPIRIDGHWKGRVLPDGLDGVIQLDKLRVGTVALAGAAGVEARPERITVNPRGLTVNEPNLAGETVQLAGGAAEISREQATLNHLAVAAGAVGARIDGQWNWDARAGTFSGSWAAALPDQSSQYLGTYQVAVKSPRLARKEIQAHLTGQAQTPVGSGRIAADVQGAGAAWQSSQWQVSIPSVVWSRGERQVDVCDVAARLDVRWPEIQLVSLRVPEAGKVNAAAQFDVGTRLWSARLEVEQLRLRSLTAGPLALHLHAEGDTRTARFSELRAAQGGTVVAATGELSFPERTLQDVRLSVDWPASAGQAEPLQAPLPVGRWHLEADVAGKVQPVALRAEGALTGQDISLGKRLVERVEIPLHAEADARQIQVDTQPFALLGGTWQSTGRYEFPDRSTRLRVTATAVSLAAVTDVAGLTVASQGQARAELQLTMPDFDIYRAVAQGSWEAQKVRIPPLAAERAHGTLRIGRGRVQIENIQLEQNGGRAQASIEFRTENPQDLSVELAAQAWALPLEGYSLVVFVDGRTKLRVNPAGRTAQGEARLAGRVVWSERDFADVRLFTLVQGQTLDIRELQVETLGGSAEGKARIPLSEWTGSVAQLRWQGIQPQRLQAWLPPLARSAGTLSGSLRVEQTKEQPHAPEPLRVVLEARMAGGRFGPAQMDSAHVVSYLGRTRLLIDEANIRALGGTLDARARLSAHANRYYGSLVADFNELSLSQLARVIDPNAGEYPGLLSGNASVLSSFDGVTLGGGARVNLARTDLASNSVVRTLYNALNWRFGKQQPTGTGEIELQLEDHALVIPSFFYFNRGVEIRGAGRVGDLRLGAASPVDGYAVASTRVLKGIKLPGVAALDRLMSVFQTGAASVKIGGTLEETEVKVVALPEILGPFRNLLWAQLRE